MARVSSNKFYLERIVDVEFLTPVQIYESISNGRALQTEKVLVGGNEVPFRLDLPRDVKLAQTKWTDSDEVVLAIALRKALAEVRDYDPGLLNDHGVWTWIALGPLRDYVVARWCDGYGPEGRPERVAGCAYFLTGDGVHAQSRCAPRRLYIAAETSFRADGDDRSVEKFLQKSDIFSSIFERKLGLDSELAVEMLNAFLGLKASRSTYRKASKLIGLILGTTCLEALDRKEKESLVAAALAEVASSLIDD